MPSSNPESEERVEELLNEIQENNPELIPDSFRNISADSSYDTESMSLNTDDDSFMVNPDFLEEQTDDQIRGILLNLGMRLNKDLDDLPEDVDNPAIWSLAQTVCMNYKIVHELDTSATVPENTIVPDESGTVQNEEVTVKDIHNKTVLEVYNEIQEQIEPMFPEVSEIKEEK